jgi:hypothetical protein
MDLEPGANLVHRVRQLPEISGISVEVPGANRSANVWNALEKVTRFQAHKFSVAPMMDWSDSLIVSGSCEARGTPWAQRSSRCVGNARQRGATLGHLRKAETSSMSVAIAVGLIEGSSDRTVDINAKNTRN